MEVEQIVSFWIDSAFLERFKKIGEYYLQKIKEEENGFKQTERTVSGRRY